MIKDPVHIMHITDINILKEHIATLPPWSMALEMGSFVCGSAFAIADANPKVEVHTIDNSDLHWLDEPENTAREYLEKQYPDADLSTKGAQALRREYIGLLPNLYFHYCDSRNFAPRYAPSMALLDASKTVAGVLADFWHCYDICRSGAVIFGNDLIFEDIQTAVSQIELCLDRPVTKHSEQLWSFTKD